MSVSFKNVMKAAKSSSLGKIGLGVGGAALAAKILSNFKKWKAGGAEGQKLPPGATDCGWGRAVDQKKPSIPGATDCGWDRALETQNKTVPGATDCGCGRAVEESKLPPGVIDCGWGRALDKK